MTAEIEDISFGRYLKKVRQKKGLSLEEISAETRIAINILHLIENEKHERLPAEVFVKGFLRAYAGTVATDSDEVLQLYRTSLDRHRETERSAASHGETGSRFWRRLFFSLCALGCLMALAIFMSTLIRQTGH